MKVLKGSLIGGVIVCCIMVFGLNHWDVLYGRYIAQSFFSHLTTGNLTAASEDIYFHREDGTYTREGNGANATWIERVQNLQEQGIHAVSFKSLKVQNDDGEPVGSVILTLEEKGELKDYRLVFFFKGNLSDFGIIRFQQIEAPDQYPKWQEALSGAL
ncbi:hypothetical protein [Paenibacillus paeoniae]|uniref:DUF4829 domain-containing protein n=1 Tax=Paenibacillus paeoniae TaxID=2292705 RepID=A0A371PKG6_9BACL|nr:hypothetical protein [Paenibacillus paeoniae]REK76435.1 hypothetical protein DX130_05180 [Paenibacillus paeoniae]